MIRAKNFVYQFLYPSIAGSMIYGTTEYLTQMELYQALPVLLIVAMMTLDYWHLNYDLLPEAHNHHKFYNLLIDVAIPILFAMALHNFTKNNVGTMSTLLSIVALIQLFYPSFGIKNKEIYVLSKIILAMFSSIFSFIVVCGYWDVSSTGSDVLYWLLFLTLLYLIHTFFVTPYAKRAR